MERCDHLEDCCFFREYSTRRSAAWQELVADYCHGSLKDYCKRRKSYLRTGIWGDPLLAPIGELPETFQRIP